MEESAFDPMAESAEEVRNSILAEAEAPEARVSDDWWTGLEEPAPSPPPMAPPLELSPPRAEPAVNPGLVEPPASPLSMKAGELSRGRRRDLEAGTTLPNTIKLVYWGPGRSGKTTNLKWLHGRLRPDLRGTLISLDGLGERTLYFDSLPIQFAANGGAPISLRLYTVPGQPRFRLTRRLVLEDVDGIVFVWDVRARRLNANLASLMEMRETLAELGRSWSQVPRVIQYNKLDLAERMETAELNHVLGRMGEGGPRILSVATSGTGVLETLSAITSAALREHAEWLEARA